jgi:hypothetical protein
VVHKIPPFETEIPSSLHPQFQEYDVKALDLFEDANLVIQHTLEFGGWDEMRWLFAMYGSKRIRTFLRQHGEHRLRPVVFNYWRKLMRIRKWHRSPFPTRKGELWPF